MISQNEYSFILLGTKQNKAKQNKTKERRKERKKSQNSNWTTLSARFFYTVKEIKNLKLCNSNKNHLRTGENFFKLMVCLQPSWSLFVHAQKHENMVVCALWKGSRNKSLYSDEDHSRIILLPRWRKANSI